MTMIALSHPRGMDVWLWGSLLFSLCLHLLLILFVPGFRTFPMSITNKVLEVELLPSSNLTSTQRVQVFAEIDSGSSAIVTASSPESMDSSLLRPNLSLPVSTVDSLLFSASMWQESFSVITDRFSTGISAARSGSDSGINSDPSFLGELPDISDELLRQPFSGIPLEPERLWEAEIENLPSPIQRNIEGPAARRTVLFQPEIPIVRVRKQSLIRLKFWVLPDGTVGRVIPLRKGDPELEQLAIEYLKRWIFTPAPRSSDTAVWGVLTIRFKIS